MAFHLRSTMRSTTAFHLGLVIDSPTRSQPRAAYIAQDPKTATHVFVRYSPVFTALQPHYLSPFRLLECWPANFVVDINEARDTIALEWLKPAFSESPLILIFWPCGFYFLAVPPSAGYEGLSSPVFLSSPPLRRVHWDDISHQLPL
ncbi:hypothetical protein MRX96_027408 [Rhipicephalus microplus]